VIFALQSESLTFVITGVKNCAAAEAKLREYVSTGQFVSDANALGIPLTGASIDSFVCVPAAEGAGEIFFLQTAWQRLFPAV